MPVFAIHSRKTITPGGIKDATIIVSNGLITDIIKGPPPNFNYELIDVGEKVLMPGVIDPHVHINEPGRTDWEGFDTATRAAISGGITMLVDMPLNSSPVTTTAMAFDEKINAARNQLHTDLDFGEVLFPAMKMKLRN